MITYTPTEFKIARVRDCVPMSEPCDSPKQLFDYWNQNIPQADWFGDSREHLIVVMLNAKLRVMGHHLVSIGLNNEAHYHAREVLRPVILAAAHAFCLMHNHPSGDPTPSQADHRVTRNLKDAANLMQINFIDHVIAGTENGTRVPYFSFKEAGIV
jgi:DNA repair protein RadC